MKIGIYDPYLDTLGGGERYMLQIAECFASGHDVTVFWNDKTILQKATLRFNLQLDNVHIKDNIFLPNTSFVKRMQTTKNYDIIFYLSDGSIPMLFSKKTILHFQFPVEWVIGTSLSVKMKLKRVNTIICNSQFTKQYIDKKFGGSSIVLYPPAIAESEDIKDEKKENILLTVGRFAMDKDNTLFKKQDVMINTFKSLCDNGLKSWRFILVMPVKEEDKEKIAQLHELVNDYPIEIVDDVTYDGLVRYYQKAKLYWHAAGYNQDIAQHPEKAEHFGITTVEAMHYGLVPLVYPAGGQREIIDQDVNGLFWSTEHELAAKTRELIDQPSLLKKYAEAAKIKAKNFSKEKFCRQLHDLIA